MPLRLAPLTAAMKRDGIDPGGLLYWDGSRLQVDETPFDGVGITSNFDNVIFTKFGGVVGFTHNNDAWSNSHVKFNPISPGNGLAWSSIPYWSSTSWDEDLISTTLHTAANVKTNGLGDICKLAGKTAAQANGGSISGTWRLPTLYDNQQFVGDATSSDFDDTVSPGVITFSTGYSLPALGRRNYSAGATENWGTVGYFWSSSPREYQPLALDFRDGMVDPTLTHYNNHGFAVRCVRQ